MSSLTSANEIDVAKWQLTADSVSRPAGWFLALHTADPTEAGNVGEVGSGIGYTRQAIVFDASAKPAVSTNKQEFGPATGDWGNITHISIWDASTGSTCRYKGALAAAVEILTGDKLTFEIGGLTVTFN